LAKSCSTSPAVWLASLKLTTSANSGVAEPNRNWQLRSSGQTVSPPALL
jgi:hypothetical protein